MNPVTLAKKIAILVVGIVVIIIGIILLPLPGPGFVVIAFGLFILSTEFEWADRWLSALKKKMADAVQKIKPKNDKPSKK